MCQNAITSGTAVYPPFYPDLCLYKYIEFRVSSKLFTGMIMKNEYTYITDGI